MGGLVRTTFDWVPETPRGSLRDPRVHRALEEAALACRVASTPSACVTRAISPASPPARCRG